jgi:large subunit ribosomal protein L10
LDRARKEAFVSDFAKEIEHSQAFALMSFEGITVEKMTEFRLSLRKKDVKVKVLKNTLAKKIFGDKHKDLLPHLKGTTLLAYGKDDPVKTAKAVWEWVSQEDFKMTLKSGVALGNVVSKSEMERLSKLPGREQLLVSFLWALKHHPTRFVFGLKAAPQKLGYALGALKKKKEAA